jgi:hypothetical protein
VLEPAIGKELEELSLDVQKFKETAKKMIRKIEEDRAQQQDFLLKDVGMIKSLDTLENSIR